MDSFPLQAQLKIEPDEDSIYQALYRDSEATCNYKGFVPQSCNTNGSEIGKDALLSPYSTSSESSGYASIEQDDFMSHGNNSALSSMDSSDLWTNEPSSIKSDLKCASSACLKVAQGVQHTTERGIPPSCSDSGLLQSNKGELHKSTSTSSCSQIGVKSQERPITLHINWPQKVAPQELATSEDQIDEDQAYRKAPNVDIGQLLEDVGHYEKIQAYERVPDVDINQLLALVATHLDSGGHKKVSAVDIQQILASVSARANSPDAHQYKQALEVDSSSKITEVKCQ